MRVMSEEEDYGGTGWGLRRHQQGFLFLVNILVVSISVSIAMCYNFRLYAMQSVKIFVSM